MNDVDLLIVDEQYHVFPESYVTVCCLTLENGTNLIGSHDCGVDVSSFNVETGKRRAKLEARSKIKPLVQYLKNQRVFENG